MYINYPHKVNKQVLLKAGIFDSDVVTLFTVSVSKGSHQKKKRVKRVTSGIKVGR